jgi:predicted PurR-regulated permease PerM
MTVTPVPPAVPAPDTPKPPRERVEIYVSTETIGKSLAILALIVLVIAAREALLAIALSIVLVLGMDPPVAALERRGWGRGKAAMAVFGALSLVVLGIVVWAAAPVWHSVTGFVDKLPSYIDEVQANEPFKSLDSNAEALDKLHNVAVDAAKNLPSTAIDLLGAAAGAIGQVFQLVTLAFLTLFGLIAKPALTRSALDLMRPATSVRVGRTLDEVTRTISYSLIGNIVISVIAGTVVGVTAVIVGAPSPMVLALIVGLFDLIPQVGSAIAAFIVCIATLIASGLGPALILLAVILIYQQLENYMIQPAVMRQAVELSGFATIAVVLLGSALLGVVGAVLAVPVAASVKVIVREATAGRRERMELLRAGDQSAATL